MKSFILPHGKQSLDTFFSKLPEGQRFKVTVEEYKSKRSLEQNARYWVILTQISEQVTDENERKYSPEVWHEFFKAKFLGKDAVIIDNEPVLLPRTTTTLKVLEFGDYMTQCEAWAVDHGVKFYESEAVA